MLLHVAVRCSAAWSGRRKLEAMAYAPQADDDGGGRRPSLGGTPSSESEQAAGADASAHGRQPRASPPPFAAASTSADGGEAAGALCGTTQAAITVCTAQRGHAALHRSLRRFRHDGPCTSSVHKLCHRSLRSRDYVIEVPLSTHEYVGSALGRFKNDDIRTIICLHTRFLVPLPLLIREV